MKEFLGEKSTISVVYGGEIWMSLAAVILLWTAVVSHSVVSCYCCGRVRWNDQDNQDQEK